MKKLTTVSVVFLVVFAFAPLPAWASIVISEVMYDLPGEDTGREWIEIYNDGSSDLDLTDWKFVESGSNHSLVATGASNLPAGGYALIVSDVAKFSADWPSISTPIFDSAFTLVNTGEELALKNAAGEIVAAAAYDTSIGAAGDGNSLQFSSGVWLAAHPTPGEGNSSVAEEPTHSDNNNSGGDGDDNQSSNNENNSSRSSASSRSQTPSSPVVSKPSVFIEVTRPVLSTIESSFYAKTSGVDGIKEVEWSFGDGTVARGQRVTHTYLLPGSYTVLLTAKIRGTSEGLSARLNLTVSEPKIVIESIDTKAITLANKSSGEASLLGWKLALGGREFIFPQTIFAASGQLSVSHSVTGLPYYPDQPITLYLPSGVEIARFAATIVKVPRLVSSPVAKKAPEKTKVPAVATLPPPTASIVTTPTPVFVVEKPEGWWGRTFSWFKNIW